jgi:hypothetical protein
VAGKAKLATEALSHVLEFGGAPVTVEALIRPLQVLVVGVDDEAARAALGTDQFASGFELGHGADVGAGEVMD